MFFCLHAQEKVENINTSIKNNKIIITYDLENLKYNQVAYISVFYSTDNGKTYTGPLKALSGDVGNGITKGKGKKITWDPILEQVFFNASDRVMFRVKADIETQKVKRKVFVSYLGNINTPFGISGGLMGRTGFYVSARGNQYFNKTPQYNYDNNGILNYEYNRYYVITNNIIIPEYSVTCGANFQLGANIFYTIGLGYFNKYYLQEVYNYDYLTDNQTGTSWVNNNSHRSGLIAETGITFRMAKRLLFSANVLYDLNYINWTAGIGICF